MFEDLFIEEGEEDYMVLSSEAPRHSNLAETQPTPPNPRGYSNLCGLYNQGTTCYLNSVIQSMFMTPELRKAVFDLPLCEGNLETPSNWVPFGQKREILLALQKLFVEMQTLDVSALSTQDLTASFRWTGDEVLIQHDVQELSRVLFDAINRSLSGTPYQDLIYNLYKGTACNQIICKTCGTTREIEEEFWDLLLQVSGFSSLTQSLRSLVKFELLHGENQYFCEVCNSKSDAEKGYKLKQIPPILTFSLNRFEYDLQTLERKKVTKKFEFPLELDMQEFLGQESKYELFAVIIHIGSAHSGHYHAYIRDLLGTGVWEPVTEESKEFQDLQTELSNEELHQNWFDFNDTSVTPIKSGKIPKQFGGQTETAYMLIYRKASQTTTAELPGVPDYWEPVIENLNQTYKKSREEYEELKNWIEVQVQPAELFAFEDGLMRYLDTQTKLTDQGVSVKARVSFTFSEFKAKVQELFSNDLLWKKHFLVEGIPLSNKYFHLIRKVDLEETVSLQEANFSHKSCFLLVPFSPDPAVVTALENIGEEHEPITVNLVVFDEKHPVTVNKGWTVEYLMLKVMELSGLSPDTQTLRMLKGYNEDRDIFPNEYYKTLHSLGFYHSMKLSVKLKEEEFPGLPAQSESSDKVTVLANYEEDPNNVVQHWVSLNSRVKDLVKELKEVFELPNNQPVRLKSHIRNAYFTQEEMNLKLKKIEEFDDGGYRVTLEKGEPPHTGEMVLQIAFEPDEDPKEIFVSPKDKFSMIKPKIEEALGIDMKNYKIYRTDWLREPISVLKNEEQTLQKAVLKDADLLLIKPLDEVLATEMVKLNLFISRTGTPGDCKPLADISVNEETTLAELKQQVFNLPEVYQADKTPSQIRIRERTNTYWFGKVYREDSKSLKKLNIGFGATLVVQLLNSPDTSSQTALHLFVAERLVEQKEIGPMVSCVFEGGPTPNVDKLYKFCLETLGKDWNLRDVTLAKFVAHKFEWQVVEDQRDPSEKGSLLNQVKAAKSAQGIYNLRKGPFQLKDGDLIALRNEQLNISGQDDFQCVSDKKKKEEYLKNKREQHEETAPQRPERAIKIGDFN